MTCAEPIPWETAVAYFAGDLAADEEERVELHLMGCAACTAQLARVAAITETVRGMIPPVVSRPALDALRARGLRVREQGFAPGDRRQVVFTADVDLLVHRFEGADLAGATRVDVTIRDEATGRVVNVVDDAPFDPGAGQVLIACQRHFEVLPPDVVFEVTAHRPDGPTLAATYTVLHVYEPA